MSYVNVTFFIFSESNLGSVFSIKGMMFVKFNEFNKKSREGNLQTKISSKKLRLWFEKKMSNCRYDHGINVARGLAESVPNSKTVLKI